MQEDLKRLWDYAQKIYQEIYAIYSVTQGKEQEEIAKLREIIGIPKDKKSDFALCQRLIELKEEPILQILRQSRSEEEIKRCKKEMFCFVSQFYAKKFEEILDFIQRENLLTPFYRTLLRGVHQIGLEFNLWFLEWNAKLIESFNSSIQDEATKSLLIESIDKAEGEERGERSYSIARFYEEKIIYLSYAEAFDEVEKIVYSIESLLKELKELECEEKEEFLIYFSKLKQALQERDRKRLISRWREVDRAWLNLKGEIQIAHPFEYYEDIYRHSVAPEWDIRLKNPYAKNLQAKELVQQMQEFFRSKLGISLDKKDILDQTLFFDCMPLFFYGSLNNGLFSAQVIPNDENMPYKKIFAYTERILHALRSKPKTRLEVEVFPPCFLQDLDVLLKDCKKWKKIYDISTNGHEYGHILWVDQESEGIMNEKGEYKNLEEFKATCAGLVAYFLNQEKQELKEVILEHLHRSVKLISYAKVCEVIPYYCESLLHLYGAFESGILSFDSKLEVHWEKLQDYMLWILKIYEKLILHYVQKRESGMFLYEFLEMQEGIYLPKHKKAKEFVKDYYEKYLAIGQEVL